MFPPYEKLERYGEEAGFSPADMRALKQAGLLYTSDAADVSSRCLRAYAQEPDHPFTGSGHDVPAL